MQGPQPIFTAEDARRRMSSAPVRRRHTPAFREFALGVLLELLKRSPEAAGEAFWAIIRLHPVKASKATSKRTSK